MVHVTWKTADDIRGGVVGKHRLAGAVEDVEDVIYRLNDIAVADAQALIGRFE